MVCVDHYYVFCRPGAPERLHLIDAGFAVGARRRHAGQGTENVCFGFGDSYLELIWICDDAEARAPEVARLQLAERSAWRDQPNSPFGICLNLTPDEPAPFVSRPFCPDYLPDGVRFDLSEEHGDARQPLLFALDRPRPTFDPEHPLAAADLRELHITVPDLPADSALRTLDVPGLRVEDGQQHLMEVRLGDGDRELDLRPELPLVLRW